MEYKLQIINPIYESNWNDVLLSTDSYSFFHSSNWANVLHHSYGYTPRYLACINKKEFLISIPFMEIKSPLTGKRGISLPFSDYCDPIINNGINKEEILNTLIKFGKEANWKFFEIRGTNNIFTEANPSVKFYHHVLRLSNNVDDIFRKLRDSTRRNIEKAVRQGIQIHIGNSPDYIDEYYRLHCMTRKYHGLPPQPPKFFYNIFKFILSENLGIAILAKYQDKYVAGNVFFHFGKKAYYKYGASDRTYQQYRASNLVMWEAIKYYIERSYDSLCFGRTDISDAGLMQYKNGWGTECKLINYHKYDLVNYKFISNEFSPSHSIKTILKHFPNPLLKIMGTLIYKYFG